MKKIFCYILFIICFLGCAFGAFGMIYFGLLDNIRYAYVCSTVCAVNMLSLFNLFKIYKNKIYKNEFNNEN